MNIDFLKQLKDSYYKKEIVITTIDKFSIAQNNKPLEYITTHSAFMFPISGIAEITIEDKTFIAKSES